MGEAWEWASAFQQLRVGLPSCSLPAQTTAPHPQVRSQEGQAATGLKKACLLGGRACAMAYGADSNVSRGQHERESGWGLLGAGKLSHSHTPPASRLWRRDKRPVRRPPSSGTQGLHLRAPGAQAPCPRPQLSRDMGAWPGDPCSRQGGGGGAAPTATSGLPSVTLKPPQPQSGPPTFSSVPGSARGAHLGWLLLKGGEEMVCRERFVLLQLLREASCGGRGGGGTLVLSGNMCGTGALSLFLFLEEKQKHKFL